MARMPDLSRRAVLGLGASATLGAVGAYALDMALLPRTSRAAPAPPIGTNVPLAPARPLDPPPPAQAAPTMTTGSFVSAARGGITTNWAIARPPGQTQPLRPVIALHGKGSDAATVMAGGVEQGLAQAVNAGLPPFAVVAVDGGGSYWHKRASGEDSGAMVLDELIPMLDSQRLDTSRVAFLGWSMGGYGALLLGGRLGPARTAAICAVSPALWTSAARPHREPSTGPPTMRPTRYGACRHSARSRSEWIVATAIRSTARPSSSSLNFRIRPRVDSPPAGTTADSGARNCPRS